MLILRRGVAFPLSTAVFPARPTTPVGAARSRPATVSAANGDLLVVTGKQHFRHPAPRDTPRAACSAGNPAGPTNRSSTADCASFSTPGNCLTDGIDQRHRRDLASGGTKSPIRNFFIDAAFDQALVDSFVTPAEQDQAFAGLRRMASSHDAGASAACLPATDTRRGSLPCPPRCRLRRIDRGFQRLGQHHHARPTTIRPVIDRPVIAFDVIARVLEMQRPASLFRGPAGNSSHSAPRTSPERASPHRRQTRSPVRLAVCFQSQIRPAARSTSPDFGGDEWQQMLATVFRT